MLKNYLFICLFVCFVTTNLMAEIIVSANGKSQKYPDGSTLNVSAARDINIEYYGVNCFIPKGEKVSLRCSDKEDGYKIYFLGNKFKNIKIGDSVLTTDKTVSFVVSHDGVINIESGSLVVKDEKDNVAILEPGNTYKVGFLSSSDVESSFVQIENQSQQQYEQMQEDIVLSPSAPRN